MSSLPSLSRVTVLEGFIRNKRTERDEKSERL